MDSNGMHLQVEIRKKLNLWDWKTTNIYLSIGNGQQPLQWLGYVACNYVAFENGIVTTRCVPQGVLVKGKLVDIEGIIKETCYDGEKVIVEYSNGPKAFTHCWEGRICEGEKRMKQSLIKVGYDLGDNDEIFYLINEVDALVTRIVNLIYDAIEEVDLLLHRKKVEIKYDELGLPMDIITTNVTLPTKVLGDELEVQYQLDEDGNQVLDENGIPIPLPSPEPKSQKDEETYIEISLLYFEVFDYGIVQKIQLALGDKHGDASWEEFRLCREVLKGHDVQLQAIFLWYGSKGVELHDKDFGYLTFDQWQLLWKEMNIPPETLDSFLTTNLFYELKDINELKGNYQLNFYGFYAAIMHLTLALYTGYKSTGELSNLSEMVAHFIEDILVFNFESKIKSKLIAFHAIDTSKYQSIYEEIGETILEALYSRHLEKEKTEKKEAREKEATVKEIEGKEAAIKEVEEKRKAQQPPPPPPEPKEKQEKKYKKGEKEPIVMENKCNQIIVLEEVKNLIPYFRKWKILGDEWNSEMAVLAIIYALTNAPEMSEFGTLPTDELTFGMTELKRMIIAASHVAYERVPIKRVSEFSFFKTHLNESLQRGGLAKPLYSSYEQKKRYLASICLRYGGKPPPQPPLFEKK